MAKQKRKDIEEQNYETVNQFEDSQDVRADLDVQGDDSVPWKDESVERSHHFTGRFQEDRNPSRR